ncbi:hypothetical protein EVG20_g5361 [Dentipellis fragilis]|uniref:Uncharacterized protein n=1 Tax=Dentipellis fragilis TaxID=205917 RepID=A0A4Y9YX66_9AGAM|nr:hypothetical protein EVG20_g5361 [Dentipellis fragilis]
MRSFDVNAFVAVLFGLQIVSTVAAPVNGTDTTDPDVAAQEANLPPNETRAGLCGSRAFNPFMCALIFSFVDFRLLTPPPDTYGANSKGPKSDLAIIGKDGKQVNLFDLCKGFPIASSSVIATATPTASGGTGGGQCATVTVTVTAPGGPADPTGTSDPFGPISIPSASGSSPLSLPTIHRILPIDDSE